MVLVSGLGRKRRNEIIAGGKVWDEGMVVSRAPLEVHPCQPMGQVRGPSQNPLASHWEGAGKRNLRMGDVAKEPLERLI